MLSLTQVGDADYPYSRWWADRKRWCVEDRVSSLLEAVSGLDYALLTCDGTHPSYQGSSKLADVMLASIP